MDTKASNKKPLAIVAVVALIAVAYPAASWFMGSKIESQLNEYYEMSSNSLGPLKNIVERNFKRGVFSSEETLIFNLRKLARPDLLPPPAGEDDPAKIVFRTTYSHGPLPGFSSLGLAKFKTQLVLSEKYDKPIRDFFKGQDYLNITGHLNFDGSGTSKLSIPTFEFTQMGMVSFGGLELNVDFAAKMKDFNFRMSMPSIEAKGMGQEVKLSQFNYTGRYRRPFNDIPEFMLPENIRFTLNEFYLKKGGEVEAGLQKFTAESATVLEGEFFNTSTKLGFEGLQAKNEKFGESHFDMSIQHIHAKTAAKLMQLGQKLYRETMAASMSLGTRGNPTPSPESLTELIVLSAELIKNQPEFKLDRLSIKSERGELGATGYAKLDTPPAPFSNDVNKLPGELRALTNLVNAELNVSMSAGFLPEPNLGAMLELLTQSGLAQKANDKYSTKIGFKAGKLSIQDKEIDPADLSSLMLGMGAQPATTNANNAPHDPADDIEDDEDE